MKKASVFGIINVILSTLVLAAEPAELSKENFKDDLGVLIIEVNWGRIWDCGQYENAQLQQLAFERAPVGSSKSETLDLKTPSKLFVKNEYQARAYVIQPGEYILTGFDVKVARSVSKIQHIKGTKDALVKDGKPVGGSFTVNPGEIVYVGHFGLDCGEEPFLWRFHLVGREDFDRYVSGFRERFPFLKDVPVQYRLFSTEVFGHPYSLEEE